MIFMRLGYYNVIVVALLPQKLQAICKDRESTANTTCTNVIISL